MTGNDKENDFTPAVPAFLQPVAVHAMDETRMVARDVDGGWWLWHGDRPAHPLEPIPAALASWLASRPEMRAMAQPCFWFPLDALPVRAEVDATVPPGHGD